jgi:hypothetical protein
MSKLGNMGFIQWVQDHDMIGIAESWVGGETFKIKGYKATQKRGPESQYMVEILEI